MMSDRLNLIKSLIVPADTVADVGCDHGIVAEYCAKSGVAKQVIASDISEKSLLKAKQRLEGADNVRFVCCDGIDYECDEAIIAGMGGMLICDILRSAKRLPETVVVGAHTDSDKVRHCLTELGYGIDKDVALVDRNKFYFIIRAEKSGGQRELSELQYLFGVDCEKPSAPLKSRLIGLYSVYMRSPERNAQKISQIKAALTLQGVDYTQLPT